MTDKKRITIIGGGASGTLLAINLLIRQTDQPIEINLIEKRERLGRGVAYSTVNGCHLLNVPAAKMGAFPDDVEHFYRWLADNNFNYAPSSFVPRQLFGQYLSKLLETAVAGARPNSSIRFFYDEAIEISSDDKIANASLASGANLQSEKVVLAFGNFLPPHPSVPDLGFISAPKYFQDPWNTRVQEEIASEDSVLIIGTGLSMVDFAMHFHRSKHRRKIFAISTRGLLPAVHKPGFNYPSFSDEIRGITRITNLLKTVRRHIEIASTDSSDWRAVIDALRPDTQEIWLGLPTAEKKYFMQHLSRYWNVARHRMPPEAAQVIEEMYSSGRLSIIKGRLKAINRSTDKFSVSYASDGQPGSVEVDAIINCIGSESNFARLDSSLVKSLFAAGQIRNDSLSLGLDATPHGALIDAGGTESKLLYTLGTSLKGVLWESTAIPEIRMQARNLAERLLAA